MDEKAGNIAGLDIDHECHEYPRQASNVDVARVALTVATPNQVIQAHQLLKDQQKIVGVKNSFSAKTPRFGFRRLLLNVVLDGIVTEAQIRLAPLDAIMCRMDKLMVILRSFGFRSYVSAI